MTPLRYIDVSSGKENLTPKEIYMGWHFCKELDQMLVGPGMEEMYACPCFRKQCPTCEE